MVNRRHFLGALGASVAAGISPMAWSPRGLAAALEALSDPLKADRAPDVMSEDEDFWAAAQQAFTVDRSLINLNNGGVSPAPAVVQNAARRHREHSHTAPSRVLWRLLAPRRESVRVGLARLFGASPEEIAITRNTTESLQTCQLGLDLARGDEVLTTDQDYPRMLHAFEQRKRREGLVLRKISLPVPCEDPTEVVRRFEAAISERTRLILVSHVINLTGQILPVREVVRLGRARGIPVIVDGAHSFAHLPFKQADLDCDYFGTSLHKWLFAPHGTGLLYVRREKVKELWPLMAADESLEDDIRKFEQIGTHPLAPYLAIGEAITFHDGLGIERKAARLRYLKETWAHRLGAHDRIRLHTSLDPRFSGGIATVQIDGIDSGQLNQHLWQAHKIITTPIIRDDFQGIRVSPSVYTTMPELDRFCRAMEEVIRNGLPG